MYIYIYIWCIFNYAKSAFLETIEGKYPQILWDGSPRVLVAWSFDWMLTCWFWAGGWCTGRWATVTLTVSLPVRLRTGVLNLQRARMRIYTRKRKSCVFPAPRFVDSWKMRQNSTDVPNCAACSQLQPTAMTYDPVWHTHILAKQLEDLEAKQIITPECPNSTTHRLCLRQSCATDLQTISRNCWFAELAAAIGTTKDPYLSTAIHHRCESLSTSGTGPTYGRGRPSWCSCLAQLRAMQIRITQAKQRQALGIRKQNIAWFCLGVQVVHIIQVAI